MKGLLISALLVSLIVYTGIELAVTRHEARQLFSQLEKMRADVYSESMKNGVACCWNAVRGPRTVESKRLPGNN